MSDLSELEKQFKNISKIVDARAEKQKMRIRVKLPSGDLKWLYLEDMLEMDDE